MMAKRPSLGARRLVQRGAEPERVEEEDPEAEAALDAAVENLKSVRDDPRALLAALDDVERLVGNQGDWPKQKQENLRANLNSAGRSKADIARQGLAEHLDWIDQTNLSDVERALATVHAFASRVDDLDPQHDADTIAAAHRIFAAVNPQDSE